MALHILSADEEPIPIPLEVVCDQVQPSYDDDNEEEEYGDDFIADMASAGVGWRAPNELYSLMVKRKWECVYDMIEDDPQQAHQWQYGIEVNNSDDKKESLMWKRLPIHNCCRLGAPVAVLDGGGDSGCPPAWRSSRLIGIGSYPGSRHTGGGDGMMA